MSTRNPPRVVEPAPTPTVARVGGGLPEWSGAVLAAVQAAVLSLLVMVLPAIAAALTSATDPSDAEGWSDALTVGLRGWLLAHGLPVAIDGARLSVLPLGLTAVAVYGVYASTRRTGVASRAGLVVGASSYALIVALVATLADADLGRVAVATVGGLVVGGVGTSLGLVRRRDAPSWRQVARPSRLPGPVRAGLRAGALATAALILVSALVVGVWVLAGRATIGDVVGELPLDAVGGAVFAVGQVAYVPNLVVWALAWLVGPGFVVGAGTHFQVGSVVAGPMPAIPLLGALPTSTLSGRSALLVPLLVVAIGVLVGIFVHRWAAERSGWDPLASVATTAAVVTVGVGLLVAASSGSAGPGRMAAVGAAWWQVGPLAGALVGLGALVGAVPTSTVFRARVGQWRAERSTGRRIED